MPYRLKIVLLALGVVLGYGSAIAHAAHWHGYHTMHCHDGHHAGSWWNDDDADHGAPPKKVQ
jgi:hypothetical protein